MLHHYKRGFQPRYIINNANVREAVENMAFGHPIKSVSVDLKGVKDEALLRELEKRGYTLSGVSADVG